MRSLRASLLLILVLVVPTAVRGETNDEIAPAPPAPALPSPQTPAPRWPFRSQPDHADEDATGRTGGCAGAGSFARPSRPSSDYPAFAGRTRAAATGARAQVVQLHLTTGPATALHAPRRFSPSAVASPQSTVAIPATIRTTRSPVPRHRPVGPQVGRVRCYASRRQAARNRTGPRRPGRRVRPYRGPRHGPRPDSAGCLRPRRAIVPGSAPVVALPSPQVQVQAQSAALTRPPAPRKGLFGFGR